MAYRLTSEESVPAGLLRVLNEEIQFAIAQLRSRRKSDRDERIHEARKCIKKLRALIRLRMPGLGDAGRRNNALLRDAGRALSEFRDAAALVETLNALLERYTEETSAKALGDVRAGFLSSSSENSSDPHAAILRTMADLRVLRRELSAWPVLSDDFSAMAPGLERTYRKGRRALASAKETPTAENFHELRKAVKDHWYHIRLLEGVWAEQMEARQKCLKELQEWLGDDHNLAVLKGRIAPDNAFVLALLSGRQAELRESSLRMAEKIYIERPRDHLRRMARLWKAWRPLYSNEARN